jgi:hypothetical protein
MTHRYQCPHCSAFHDRDAEPKCGTHGLGYSPRCATCVQLAKQTSCGGTR